MPQKKHDDIVQDLVTIIDGLEAVDLRSAASVGNGILAAIKGLETLNRELSKNAANRAKVARHRRKKDTLSTGALFQPLWSGDDE